MSVVPPEPFPTRFSLWAATRFRACWRNVEVSDDGYGEVRTAIRGSGSVLTSSRRPIALEPVIVHRLEAKVPFIRLLAPACYNIKPCSPDVGGPLCTVGGWESNGGDEVLASSRRSGSRILDGWAVWGLQATNRRFSGQAMRLPEPSRLREPCQTPELQCSWGRGGRPLGATHRQCPPLLTEWPRGSFDGFHQGEGGSYSREPQTGTETGRTGRRQTLRPAFTRRAAATLSAANDPAECERCDRRCHFQGFWSRARP